LDISADVHGHRTLETMREKKGGQVNDGTFISLKGGAIEIVYNLETVLDISADVHGHGDS
jgi:hypothetical protein